MKKKAYKVTYSSTRAFDTFKTKKAAVAQARFAVRAGNMQSCVQLRLPSGRWMPVPVKCVRRRRGR